LSCGAITAPHRGLAVADAQVNGHANISALQIVGQTLEGGAPLSLPRCAAAKIVQAHHEKSVNDRVAHCPSAPVVVRLFACNGVKVTPHGPFYWTRSGIFSHQSSSIKERSHHNVLDKLAYLIRRASLREEDFPCVT
jgi:hypothetical protein